MGITDPGVVMIERREMTREEKGKNLVTEGREVVKDHDRRWRMREGRKESDEKKSGRNVKNEERGNGKREWKKEKKENVYERKGFAKIALTEDLMDVIAEIMIGERETGIETDMEKN